MAGYENRAPLGIRDSSGRLLKSLLLHEEILLRTQSLSAAHAVFRSLDQVADLDGALEMHGYYMTYDQAGMVDDLIKKCQQFPEKYMTDYKCYRDGDKGCENPPPDHVGVLRDFYSFLQTNRHCEGVLRDKYSDLPSTDSLIRLIYIDTVKENFKQHHQKEFADYNTVLEKLDISSDLRIENFFAKNRSENMKFLNASSEAQKPWSEDFDLGDKTDNLWFFHWDATLMSLKEAFGFGHMPIEACIPFSWVEEGAEEEDRCFFSDYVKLDMNPTEQAHYHSWIEALIINKFAAGIDPVLLDYEHFSSNINEQKKIYLNVLQGKLNNIKNFKPSSFNQHLIDLYSQKLIEAQSRDDRQTVEYLLSQIPTVQSFLDQEIERVKNQAFGPDVVKMIGYRKDFYSQKTNLYRELLKE